jgi:hypothetical protein
MEDLAQKFFEVQTFDFNEEKRKFINSMDELKKKSVEEFTFYKKWEEISQIYGKDSDFTANSPQVKAKIWTPKDINDEAGTIKEIQNLRPRVHIVKGPVDENTWTQVRIFCHSAEYNQAPGRFIKILILNEDDKILGFCAVASELISIRDRDEYIGWTHEQRLAGKLRYSAVGTTIAATQPFGYNFLGGKLSAAMVVSKSIREAWAKDYDNDTLVGMTTTSLYGPFSMYNNHKWWRKCGVSTGKVPIKSDERFYKIWHDWLKENRSEEYLKKMTQKEGISGPVTGAKMRVLYMIYDTVGIKQSDYQHGYERGVYYSCFYENTKEFLCDKIQEKDLKLKPLFENDMDSILDWWKPKAIERYKKLKSEDRLNTEKLFYNGMKDMTYDEAKQKYFHNVGR